MTENVYKAKTVSDNEVIELLRKHIEANIAMMDLSPKGSEISEFEKRLDAYGTMIDAMQEIQQYREIGTVEECREAMERQRAKKPNIITGKTEKDKLACCPICESNLDWTYDGFWRKGNPKYCSNCGQAIDWSDTN